MKRLIENAIQFQIDHNGFPNGLPNPLTFKGFAPLYNDLHGFLEGVDEDEEPVELCHWMAYIRDKVREYDEQYLQVSDEEMDKLILEAVGKGSLDLKV